MPNHVSNALTVTGDDAERFFKKVESFTDDNFIAGFIPMPEELSGITTGGCVIDGEQVREWRVVDGVNVKITDIERQHIIDLYGTADWYTWANANWGTKWGAYDVRREDGRILFDSAWAPPVPAIEKISQKFPRATFTLAFAEGGSCFFGYVTVENGGIIDTEESDQFWREDADWDQEDYDTMDMLTPECREHIEAHGLHTGG